jgi:uncharacterized membrane protein YphA (DoxX/SURF4 family)
MPQAAAAPGRMLLSQSDHILQWPSIDATILHDNAALVARAAQEFKVSTILTTAAEKTFFGPMFDAIVTELGGSLLILFGWYRWVGAACLDGFTLLGSFMANAYWRMPPGSERFMAANGFYERLGLVGGFLLVALVEMRAR